MLTFSGGRIFLVVGPTDNHRNWLLAGSLRGGRAAAVVYTLIESCRIADVDVVAYLADVLVRVATHPARRIDELLPENWADTVAAPEALEPALT